jgi:hypothetical protein
VAQSRERAAVRHQATKVLASDSIKTVPEQVFYLTASQGSVTSPRGLRPKPNGTRMDMNLAESERRHILSAATLAWEGSALDAFRQMSEESKGVMSILVDFRRP